MFSRGSRKFNNCEFRSITFRTLGETVGARVGENFIREASISCPRLKYIGQDSIHVNAKTSDESGSNNVVPVRSGEGSDNLYAVFANAFGAIDELRGSMKGTCKECPFFGLNPDTVNAQVSAELSRRRDLLELEQAEILARRELDQLAE